MSITLHQFMATHYVWDCWYLPGDQGGFHAFMLASERRHKESDVHDQHSELVYCTSPDLRTFEVVKARGLAHGEDESIWTGCTRRIGDEYLLFHTVRQSADGYWAQQVIRLARSKNLRDWEPMEGFELTPEQFGGPESPFANRPRAGDRTIHSWRDPHVFFHDGGWWMLISATRKDAGPKHKACVTLLRADRDPRVGASWKLATPVLVTGYEELDVPQLYLDKQTGEAVLVASLFSESDYAKSMDLGYDPFTNPPHTKYRSEGRLVGFRAPDLASALAGRFLEPEKEQVLIDAGETLYAGVVVPELDGGVIGVDLLGGPPKLVERRLPSLRHVYRPPQPIAP